MPAQIVLAHDNEAFRAEGKAALEANRHTVACYPDAVAAAGALSVVKRVELLITRLRFQPGRSNRASLAMMLKVQKPGLRVIFVAAPEMQQHVADLGTFMPTPVTISDLVAVVQDELCSGRRDP